MNTREIFLDDEDLENRFSNDEFDEDDLAEKYIPNLRKEAKRTQVAKDSQKNKWRIKN